MSLAAAASSIAVGLGSAPAGAATQVYNTIDAGQTYLVPPGATSVTVDVVGATGGTGSGEGIGGVSAGAGGGGDGGVAAEAPGSA